MVKLARSDGVDERETRAIEGFALARGVGAPRVASLFAAAASPPMEIPEPLRLDETRAWLELLADIAWADGVVTRPELGVLRALGRRAGFSDLDVQQILKKRRTALLRGAREAAREERRQRRKGSA
jgi:hypothetical protein